MLGGDRNAIGSISFVLDVTKADGPTVDALSAMVRAGAREVERAMMDMAGTDGAAETPGSQRRMKASGRA